APSLRVVWMCRSARPLGSFTVVTIPAASPTHRAAPSESRRRNAPRGVRPGARALQADPGTLRGWSHRRRGDEPLAADVLSGRHTRSRVLDPRVQGPAVVGDLLPAVRACQQAQGAGDPRAGR